MKRFDLHVHSKYSADGVLEPKKIVDIASKRELDGIAITDHNTVRGGLQAKEYETRHFQVIVGSEVMTDRGEVIGLFLSKEVKSRDIRSAINEIKQQGGIVVVPHPFDRLRKSAFRVTDEVAHLVDAIEGFNSRTILAKDNRKAVEFAIRHNLSIIGSSDAHYANEIGKGGVIVDTEDIREAICQNNIQVFGVRSPLVCHVKTKILKWRRGLP